MKRLIFISIILIVGFSSFKIDRKEKNPPGTNYIGENLFFDRTEIRNADWREFMYWTKRIYGEESKEYLSTIPDTTVWNGKGQKPFQEYYLTHPAYSEYPIVGISYEQALAYCNWRSDRVNETIYIIVNKLEVHTDKYYKDFPKIYKYRLPTKEEWERIAKLDYSEKTKKQLSKKKYSDISKYNLLSENEEKNQSEIDIKAPVNSYWPNEKGIYNLIGNVAEMISENGIAKGGSWLQKVEEIDIKKDFRYEKPTNWIGFRCICEKLH